ncbi:MAG TPA: hypothetical protein VE863_12965 [Pyrinomonadaceae bacterium]|nr:hypothetical protein [Pyrinomonadaceae bacterium]
MIRILVATIFLLIPLTARAQSLISAVASETNNASGIWTIKVSFSEGVDPKRMKHLFLLKTDAAAIVELKDIQGRSSGLGIPSIYSATSTVPLEVLIDGRGNRKLHYQLWVRLANKEADKEDLSLNDAVVLLDEKVPLDAPKQDKAKAKKVDDADVYISGELNGAHKNKTRYSTELKYQHFRTWGSWQQTPFFHLNASTDPDADPDKMEIGWTLRRISNAGYFDNKPKLESERDFDNTNFIYDVRFTFLPHAMPKGKGNVKFFLNPFLGGEFGKNLRSPLKAAQGDGIARLLAGGDLRVAFWLHKDSDQPEINWMTSYVRRWLLSDELSFKTDKDGNLQLRQFGKSPRDYVSSKVAYSVSKFFDVFLEYEWGQEPPSYKFIDHRFRVGFAYKYKFAK